MRAVIDERLRHQPLGDGGHHVERRPGVAARPAGGEIAIGIVGECGVGDAVVGADNTRQRMRACARAIGEAIGRAADIRLLGDVAGGVVGDGLRRRGSDLA